ncbi:hypothetical protein GF378_01785 [Candidatus Pacearchaeota archaeon]|nr:hypothetical protein [Candidatus Pacearchaeota archaeon]
MQNLNRIFRLRDVKKAQVASTATWIIATLIILLFLGIYYFSFTTILLEEGLKGSIDDEEASIGGKGTSILITKTAIAYLLTPEEDREVVEKWLEKKEIDLDDYINE